jgi:hypothetical protein
MEFVLDLAVKEKRKKGRKGNMKINQIAVEALAKVTDEDRKTERTTFNLKGKATNPTWANMSDEEKAGYVATLTPAHSIGLADGNTVYFLTVEIAADARKLTDTEKEAFFNAEAIVIDPKEGGNLEVR